MLLGRDRRQDCTLGQPQPDPQHLPRRRHSTRAESCGVVSEPLGLGFPIIWFLRSLWDSSTQAQDRSGLGICAAMAILQYDACILLCFVGRRFKGIPGRGKWG